MPSDAVYVFARADDGAQPIVGALRRSSGGGRPIGVFAYARSWIENHSGLAFALDPERMPLIDGEFTTDRRSGVPGPLADALPDRWGRRVIQAQNSGRAQSDLDLLLMTGPAGIGRLAFSATPSPPAVDGAEPAIAEDEIDAIGEAFAAIEQGLPAAPQFAALYAAGRSLGGARPKTSLRHDGALWIAKFERRDDEFDQCAAEHATMRLAAACGLDVARTRVLDTGARKALLVRRFDRDGSRPSAHYLSALSALDLDETSSAGGYPQLGGWLRRNGRDPAADMRELFARMIFNILCGNRDDHLKNHALLRRDDGWRLSPAFDLAPQPGMEALQAISVGAFGAVATIANALSRCGDFALSREEAECIVARVTAAMTGWRDRFAEWGAPRETIRKLEGAFSAELDRTGG